MALPRVLILHTGGTLGMAGGSGPLRPAHFAERLRERIPELWQIARIDLEIFCNVDSSDLGPPLWQGLARRIFERLPRYAGIVVTHGTDTMAYTASALSLMLRGLDRPVVLTGSQRPLAEIRTDARLNLIDAVTAAARGPDLPEVVICFDSRLFRGNRARKVKIAEYDAFDSPNLPPLGGLGVEVTIEPQRRRRGRPRLLDALETAVHAIHVFPGMDPAPHLAWLESGRVKGMVLFAFGAGNFPLAGERSLLPLFERARDLRIPVLVGSQAHRNAVDLDLYESGAAARELGAIGAGDMTPETCLVKMMHALAYGRTLAGVRRILEANLAGERTPGT